MISSSEDSACFDIAGLDISGFGFDILAGSGLDVSCFGAAVLGTSFEAAALGAFHFDSTTCHGSFRASASNCSWSSAAVLGTSCFGSAGVDAPVSDVSSFDDASTGSVVSGPADVGCSVLVSAFCGSSTGGASAAPQTADCFFLDFSATGSS
jgi:hypothetical protein